MNDPVVSNIHSVAILNSKKEDFLELLRKGLDENKACAHLNIPERTYFNVLFSDESFRTQVEESRKRRAEVWFNKIMDDVDAAYSKDETPGQKLRFEKLKYLARMDNPERYGEKTQSTIDVIQNINLAVKGMSTEEAKKILSEDPFSAIPAEFTSVNDEDNPL